MSRRGTGPGGVRGDLATGFDLPDALAGAELVVHAASDPRNAWEVDVAGTRRLVQAVDRGRLRHLVYVSIVGVDRIPSATTGPSTPPSRCCWPPGCR